MLPRLAARRVPHAEPGAAPLRRQLFRKQVLISLNEFLTIKQVPLCTLNLWQPVCSTVVDAGLDDKTYARHNYPALGKV